MKTTSAAPHGWLERVLPAPPARVLDAGCGRGALAGMLASRGYDVTAIDADPVAVDAARQADVPARLADLIDYDDQPFDVVILKLSLHHMAPLALAAERASALVASDGLLILDEFAWDWADEAAAAWFYDTAALLAAASVLELKRPSAEADPMRRWRAGHAEYNGGDAMVEAIAARLTVTEHRRGPYLAGYLGGMLEDTERGDGIRAELQRIERDRIAANALPPVGFHLVARHHRS